MSTKKRYKNVILEMKKSSKVDDNLYLNVKREIKDSKNVSQLSEDEKIASLEAFVKKKQAAHIGWGLIITYFAIVITLISSAMENNKAFISIQFSIQIMFLGLLLIIAMALIFVSLEHPKNAYILSVIENIKMEKRI